MSPKEEPLHFKVGKTIRLELWQVFRDEQAANGVNVTVKDAKTAVREMPSDEKDELRARKKERQLAAKLTAVEELLRGVVLEEDEIPPEQKEDVLNAMIDKVRDSDLVVTK